MCGIYLTNKNFSELDVKAKLESIRFRGPDYTGIKRVDGLIFGHLRLSILDLDIRSNQPYEFGDFIMVFNGEIYNFQDIKKELIDLGYSFNTSGDTEVLLKGYKEWGEEVVPRLNGMFSFAIYNKVTKKIFCSRDRLGVKPFYYSWKDDYFEICSQLRPISQNKNINDEAISMYLDCGYIPSPYTIYNEVYKLQPGNNLEIDLVSKQLKVIEYWNLKKVVKSDLSYDEAKCHLHNLLKDAVKIRLHADVPFGCFLSGGIDSALITSISAKLSKDQIRTFSIGFEDTKYDESKIAEQYSNIIGSVHKNTICKSDDILNMLPKLIEVYDEPFADSSALPSLLLNKITKEYVTMALSGDGGDESFLGYNHFDWVSKFQKLLKIPYIFRFLLSKLLVFNVLASKTQPLKRILNTKMENDFSKGIFLGFNSLLIRRDLNWFNIYSDFSTWSNDFYQQTADLNIKLWLENDSNVKVDRASMAYSVEVRSPFLDYRIIEFARTLPISYRFLPGRKKRILRDILKEYIPEEIFNQPKKGFAVPIADWIRKDLKDEFLSNLTDDFLNQVPNLNVGKFKKMIETHMSEKADYSSYIWRLYVLSKWYQEFGFYKKTYG